MIIYYLDQICCLACRNLFKFREGAIAITDDIEQMFLQVKVKQEDTYCLRLLYPDNKNKSDKIKIYKYNRHIFGARSSPTCANYALTKSFETDNLQEMSNHFCMDDFIYSSKDRIKAEKFKQQVHGN